MSEGEGEERVFRADEDRDCSEVLDYLGELSTDGNPFDCPNLRVLPEDIKVIQLHAPPNRYKGGSLMCTERARSGVSRRCGGVYFWREPSINEDGDLVYRCDWPLNGEIILRLRKDLQ